MKIILAVFLVNLKVFDVSPAEDCPGPNEKYSNCGSACPETCSGKPEICIAICVPGCFCAPGFVQGPNGRCIPPSQC